MGDDNIRRDALEAAIRYRLVDRDLAELAEIDALLDEQFHRREAADERATLRFERPPAFAIAIVSDDWASAHEFEAGGEA